MKNKQSLPFSPPLLLVAIIMALLYYLLPLGYSQGIIEVGDTKHYLPFEMHRVNKKEVKPLSDSLAFILSQEHAKYVERRFELLKELYKADSLAFKKYAELIFWEINSVFPENLKYREKIEKLEKENPSISSYHTAEREAWAKYKEIENKYY